MADLPPYLPAVLRFTIELQVAPELLKDDQALRLLVAQAIETHLEDARETATRDLEDLVDDVKAQLEDANQAAKDLEKLLPDAGPPRIGVWDQET